MPKWDFDMQKVKNGCTNKLKQTASDINTDLKNTKPKFKIFLKPLKLKILFLPRFVKARI